MKNKLLPLAVVLISSASYAQVGIGTINPNKSSQLEVVASNKGILIPRVSLTNTTDITTITNGNINSLLVFNTTDNEFIKPGYYYWFVDKWLRIINQADLEATNTTNSSLTVNVNNDLVLTDSDGNTVLIPIADLNIITTLVNNNDGTYTYTSEDDTQTIINVPADVISNFENIVNNTNVLNELVEVLNETKVGGNVYYDGTSFTYVDDAGVSQTINFQEMVQDNETVTTLVNNNDGTYTYTSEDDTQTIINVPADVISNFENIVNNTNVLNVLVEVLNETKVGGNVYYDGTSFTYVDDAGVSQTINFQEMVRDNETVTTLVNNNDGTYTYTSEDDTQTIINVPADVISNFENIVNNTNVLNELVEVLNETKVGGNVYYDGTSFTYVDDAGVSQTINFQEMVQDNETVTTLVNNNDGTYTYTSEDDTQTIINVPADVISNFENIVNNTNVLNELVEVLNETKVGGNVYYDGTSFTYVDDAGVSQTINFQEMVRDNETVTTLVNNNDGTYTYTSEDDTQTIINVPADVISNFENIVNNTNVLNELVEVLNETKVGGNVYYDGTSFTYVDDAGVSQTINFQEMVQDNETVTTLVNNNDGTYTYTSEDDTQTIINVPADVISNFENIVNNTNVLNELVEVLNETKVGGNVYYDGTSFTYVDDAGVSQTINFQEMVQDNETVTTLVNNNDGTYTYTSEDDTQTIINVPADVISNFENIVNNTNVLNELVEVLNETKVGGNVYYDGTSFTYVDDAGVSQTINFQEMVQDNETVTTLVNNNDGTYTYTSEDDTQTIINVPADVISNFENIVNNTNVLNELVEVLNETKVGGNVYYDGTSFTYVDDAGVSQTINFQEMVRDNETVTTLVNNNDGTYTYTSEDDTQTIINVPADVISNFENIVNNTNVLNELVEVLNETKVGGNVYYDGTSFTYVDDAGVSQTINFQEMVQDNETVTTLVNNNDGTYTYTSEDDTQTIINVPADVISNFENIVNNTNVLNELVEVLNETKVGGNVYYDGTSFTYVDDAGVSQTINFQEMVQDNETVTTLVRNANGTYTYTNESNNSVTIDPSLVNVTYDNGIYTFTDATGATITTIDATAAGITYNNTTSQLTANNVQAALDELAGRKGTLSGTGITITGGDDATLKNTTIAITPGTAGQLMITNADGTTGWVDQDQIVPITTNTYVNNGTNTLTSTVNGEIAAASIINTVANEITGTSLITTVNGIPSSTIDLKTAIQEGQKTTQVNAGSTKVSVTPSNPTADETLYTVDVNEANLTLNNIGGTLNTNKITGGNFGQILGMMNGVPTWINDAQITRVTTNTLTLTGNTLISNVNGTADGVELTDENILSNKTLTGTGITINGGASLTGSVLKNATLAIANDAITTDKIASGAVQTSDIANNNVTAGKLNSTGATAGQVATADGAGNVTYQTPSVNTTNVTNGKALSSTDLELSANASTSLLKDVTANIKDNAITTAKLADNAITPAKINATVAGNGLVKNATTNALEVQANNGLTVDATDDAVQLGGALKKATVVTTTSSFTLALAGLQKGNATDRVVVADPTSGVLKQLKAAMPKFFYMPSIVIPTHSSQFVADPNIPGESFGTLNLYARYTRQFNTPMTSNPGKTTSLPILPANELDYYITWYDTTVFASVTVSNTGILTYTIQPDADVTVGSFMNIVFAVKEN